MEATEDDFEKELDYRRSLQSTVKKQRPQEAPTNTKRQQDAFKTPSMKRRNPLQQPIFKLEKKPSAYQRKRSLKKEFKKHENPFIKQRPGINTALDVVEIIQGSSLTMNLRSQAAKKNEPIAQTDNLSEIDKSPMQEVRSFSPEPAFNMR